MSKPKQANIQLTDAETKALAQAWIAAKGDFENKESSFKLATANLLKAVRTGWFKEAAGRHGAPTSIDIPTEKATALVSFSPVWSAKGGLDLIPADLLMPAVDVKIDVSVMGAKAETFIARLEALAEELAVTDAVEVSRYKEPVKHFNDVRCVRLTPEENAALEEAGLGTRILCRVK